MEFALGILVVVVVFLLFKYWMQISALSLVLKEYLFPSEPLPNLIEVLPNIYIPTAPPKPPTSHPDLLKLWEFAAKETKIAGLDERYVQLALGIIDLNLVPKPNRPELSFAPINSLVFAGSDEVEFSFLLIQNLPLAECPIVLTALEYTNHNVIVGSSLREFLSLGSLTGFGELDRLSSFVEDFPKNPSAKIEPAYRFPSKEAEAVLARLKDEFQLTPWKDIESRLIELHQQWGRFIEPPDEKKNQEIATRILNENRKKRGH